MQELPYISGALKEALMLDQATVISFKKIGNIWCVLCRNSKDQMLKLEGAPQYTQYRTDEDGEDFYIYDRRGGSLPTVLRFFEMEMKRLEQGFIITPNT